MTLNVISPKAPAAIKRKAPEYIKTDIVHLAALVAHCGDNFAEAGRMLGLKGSTVGDHVRAGKTTPVVELACELIMTRMGGSRPRTDEDEVLEMLDIVLDYMAETPAALMPESIWDKMAFSLRDLARARVKNHD